MISAITFSNRAVRCDPQLFCDPIGTCTWPGISLTIDASIKSRNAVTSPQEDWEERQLGDGIDINWGFSFVLLKGSPGTAFYAEPLRTDPPQLWSRAVRHSFAGQCSGNPATKEKPMLRAVLDE